MKSEVPAPRRARATPLAARLATTAVVPVRKKNGATGKIAPAAKRTKDETAAVQAEPPSSSGSMPSSSRASVSTAALPSLRRRSAMARAWSSLRPLAW